MQRFRDRRDAGAKLAQALERFASEPDVVVLALPRGGVPVAYEIATRIGAPLDVIVVRKVGVPGHAELAMGAIASGGVRIVERRILRLADISQEEFDEIAELERRELERRERVFRSDRPPVDVSGKTVILVDDGLATGSSMAAAIDAVRSRAPLRIIVAVPVGPRETCDALAARAGEVICLVTPEPMHAVGAWYQDFSQTTDAEVRELLAASATRQPARGDATPGARAASSQ